MKQSLSLTLHLNFKSDLKFLKDKKKVGLVVKCLETLVG